MDWLNPISAIWCKKTKKGSDMLSFTLEGKRYFALKNPKKSEGDNKPTWNIYESQPLDKPKQEDTPF